MKTILVFILVLLSIYLFSESGPQNPNGYKPYNHYGNAGTLNKTLPGRTNLMFAPNEASASNYTATKPEAAQQETATKEPDQFSVYPNAKDGELWVQAEDNADITELDVQIYNSSGERVYYSKLESTPKKVDLHNYVNGKYLIKVGGQTYRMMLIQ